MIPIRCLHRGMVLIDAKGRTIVIARMRARASTRDTGMLGMMDSIRIAE